MKIFVTGASGYVGSAVVRELLEASHQVLGLARSDASATALMAAGAEVQRGDLDDLDSLRRGAAAADGVIHAAFIRDVSDYARAAETDRRAIETLGSVLAGSNRPFIVTSGMAGRGTGRLITEEDAAAAGAPRFSEVTALPFASRGVRVSVVRLPPSVHSEGDTHGTISQLINIARAKGVSAHPGDGSNRWPAVHRLDAAHLYRLAVETAPAGAVFHAVADEGVSVRAIAEVIGRHLNVPVVSLPVEQAREHFGWLGAFFSINIPASSALTQQRLGWHPVGPTLLEDIEQGFYFDHGG